MDVEAVPMFPTWSNGRSRVEKISKQLDWFYLSEDLSSSLSRLCSWVVPTNFSDHRLIVLQLETRLEGIH